MQTQCSTAHARLVTPEGWRKGSKSTAACVWEPPGGTTHLSSSIGTAVTCLHGRLLLLLGCH